MIFALDDDAGAGGSVGVDGDFYFEFTPCADYCRQLKASHADVWDRLMLEGNVADFDAGGLRELGDARGVASGFAPIAEQHNAPRRIRREDGQGFAQPLRQVAIATVHLATDGRQLTCDGDGSLDTRLLPEDDDTETVIGSHMGDGVADVIFGVGQRVYA